MIDNSDVNALLHEAISAGNHNDVTNSIKNLIAKHIGGIEFRYRSVPVRTPYTCIGVHTVRYKYDPYSVYVGLIVREYIIGKLGKGNIPFLSQMRKARISAELADYLNSIDDVILPTDLDRIAKEIYNFCETNDYVQNELNSTRKVPVKIKISFFKTMVDIMTRFMRFFTK